MGPHQPLQLSLAGMAKRRVTYVMDQTDSLHQIDIGTKAKGYPFPYLRNLQRMSQTGAVKVALAGREHLRLSLQPPKSR